MMPHLYYNILDGRMWVNNEGTETTLRDFYIKARQESGIPVGTLENAVGLNHPQLLNIESGAKRKASSGQSGRWYSDAVLPMLAALEYLGYKFIVVQKNRKQ